MIFVVIKEIKQYICKQNLCWINPGVWVGAEMSSSKEG